MCTYVYMYVYIMVCMCTAVYHVVANIFLSVSVHLWGPADESTLMDENPLLGGFLASLFVSL